jgi:hypothetical protein
VFRYYSELFGPPPKPPPARRCRAHGSLRLTGPGGRRSRPEVLPPVGPRSRRSPVRGPPLLTARVARGSLAYASLRSAFARSATSLRSVARRSPFARSEVSLRSTSRSPFAHSAALPRVAPPVGRASLLLAARLASLRCPRAAHGSQCSRLPSVSARAWEVSLRSTSRSPFAFPRRSLRSRLTAFTVRPLGGLLAVGRPPLAPRNAARAGRGTCGPFAVVGAGRRLPAGAAGSRSACSAGLAPLVQRRSPRVARLTVAHTGERSAPSEFPPRVGFSGRLRSSEQCRHSGAFIDDSR